MKKLEGRIDIYATPMIVNLSFACEVYIKTLLDYLENGSKKSHKLNELLEALPDEKKSRILKEVEEKHGALADAFAKWRYSYEVSRVSCDIGYLFALTEAVRNMCCETIYGLSWEKYCKTARINSDLWG